MIVGLWNKLFKHKPIERFKGVVSKYAELKGHVSEKTGLEESCFELVSGPIIPECGYSLWLNCGGVGEKVNGEFFVNHARVTEEDFNKWLHHSRINGLRASIDTARRNKKKSSHLVAELKKLEEQK